MLNDNENEKENDGDNDGDGDADDGENGGDNDGAGAGVGAGVGAGGRRDSNAMSLAAELSNPERLFGIARICNATESVRFLLEMCQALRGDILRSLPPAHRVGANALYASAEAVTSELRSFMYAGAAARLLPIAEVTEQMKGLKWDPRDLPGTVLGCLGGRHGRFEKH